MVRLLARVSVCARYGKKGKHRDAAVCVSGTVYTTLVFLFFQSMATMIVGHGLIECESWQLLTMRNVVKFCCKS